MVDELRIVSFGGGVQSTALLVLASRGQIDFQTFVFANVGDDSENPATLVYVRDVAMPFARQHGIAIYELHRWRKDGTIETLLMRLYRSKRSMTIPVRMSGSFGFMRRNCTHDFKILRIEKWCKKHGATAAHPAITAIGISLDEAHRANSNHESLFQTKVYPLLDLRLTRDDCAAIIGDAGLPVPPKSSCWFCPYHTNGAWQAMREQQPEQFRRAVELEAMLSQRLMLLQGQEAYFHNRKKPLMEATTPGSSAEDAQVDVCESGYCML